MLRRLKKLVKKTENAKYNKLYNTLIGSIITVIGISKGMTEAQNWKMFRDLEKMSKKGLLDEYNTPLKLFDFINSKHGKVPIAEEDSIVLVYDRNGIRSPLVTFTNNGVVLPITPDQVYTGILRLAAEERENIAIEYLFREFTDDTEGLHD